MSKDNTQANKRAAIIQLAYKDKEQAARYLEHLALQLRQCDTKKAVVYAMCDVLYLSDRTIYRDLSKELDRIPEKILQIN